MLEHIAFIGGGNMASAIISGLLQKGQAAAQIQVVEPYAATRAALLQQFGITALEHADASLQSAQLVVWAVKPQTFHAAASQTAPFTQGALHMSVAAGIGSDSIAQWLGSQRVVRAMPNTPALIGKGITGLFARAGVAPADRQATDQVMASTGATVWLEQEHLLDAVTALSGSGPAYMFYLMEAMTGAGVHMGLTTEQAHQLAVATFIGAGELARSSTEPPAVLRQRVTSPGGTTFAAISAMETSDIKTLFMQAIFAAERRAQEMGREFGAA